MTTRTLRCTCAGPLQNTNVDGNGGHNFGCAVWTDPPAPPADAPTNLWDESSEWLWLRRDLADTATRAKRIAFTNRRGADGSRPLPETICGGERHGYSHLTVRAIYARPGEEHEGGWAGSGADTWHHCDPDHERAVAYWEIRADG